MIHENKIAIKVLTNEFADYPRNAWHYDREYLMICEALRLSKLHQPTVSVSVKATKDKFGDELKCICNETHAYHCPKCGLP